MINRLQDSIAKHLGLTLESRRDTMRAMLAPRVGEGVGYWLQLTMAAALATLGLALDSTAVVIGAMLIAPLMKPIVELAVGLATGSAPLVFRAGWRTVASVVAVTAVSAAITWLLPFHDVTHELAARTSPTLLDLFVAAACALVGAYSTLFSSSDMASTAAGTSIGISLVPPLCTFGYGLAIGEWHMARGAALLFTANATGIITVAGLVFVVVGFGQVDVRAEEQRIDPSGQTLASRLGRNWSQASKRLGSVSRILLPLLLLGAIFIPLRHAIEQMTRDTELRQELELELATTKIPVAQSSVKIGPTGAVVRVVVIGDGHAAKQLDEVLRAILTRRGENDPRVSVWAVPDTKMLGALSSRIDERPPPIVAEPERDLAHHTPTEILERVKTVWPAHGTGALVSAYVTPGLPIQELHVLHLGAPLGEAGRELLKQVVARAEPLEIADDAVVTADASPSDGEMWIGPALHTIELAATAASLSSCVVVPVEPTSITVKSRSGESARKREAESISVVRDIVDRTLAGRKNVSVSRGERWSLMVVLGPCPPPVEPTSSPEPATR